MYKTNKTQKNQIVKLELIQNRSMKKKQMKLLNNIKIKSCKVKPKIKRTKMIQK